MPSRRGDASGRSFDLSCRKTTSADLYLDDLARCVLDASDLQIRLPGATRGIVRVRAVVPKRDSLAARVALASVDCHWSALDQFDARHVGPVTLAMTGLEDARVTTLARRVARPDLLKELICRRALLDMTNRKAPR